jgi:ankyrin repeat protein
LSSKRPYVPDNFLDDASERIRQLVSLTGTTACPAAISLQRAPLSSLYKEMFGEAWSIARLPEQKEDAQKICSAIFFASLPNPELYVLARRDDSADPVFFERNQPECLEKPNFGERDRFLRAIRSNDVVAVTEMLSRGVDPAIAARRVNPALVTATDADNLELMRALISFGANPNTRDSAVRPLLIHVLSSPKRTRPRALQLAEFLLVSGADPNLPDANGQSVFQRLSGTDQADAVALMLKYGASVSRTVSCNGCSEEGKAPIHFARYPEIARLLVASGADVNATYGQGTTALHDAYDLEIVRILVANGANVNAYGNGWTPLMHALQMYDANRSEVQRAPQHFARCPGFS